MKNIEKNFDSALGLEKKRRNEEGLGSQTSNSDRIGFFNPVMAFMGHNGEEDAAEGPEKPQSLKHSLIAEENHSVSTEPTTSKEDAFEVLGTTQSPKQPSKLEENLSSSTESPVSKPDVSEQSVTPQTPTHPSATEEKHGGFTESPTSKGSGSEVSETPQFPTHPSSTEENHSNSIEIINSIEKENRDNQDTKYPVPDDEDLPTQLGESDRDIPDDRASSSPTKLDQPSVMETTVSIKAGKEDTDDGNASQSQPLYPSLNKVVFLDDDIVVRRDLPTLWEINLEGKVNGAVKTWKTAG